MITETPTFAPASEPASLNESDFHYYGWRVALAACLGVPRRIILPSMTVFGCGITSFSLQRSGLWEFYATCFVIGLVGNGAADLAYARSISTWFEKRLGTALAFVMVGAGLGAMILPLRPHVRVPSLPPI